MTSRFFVDLNPSQGLHLSLQCDKSASFVQQCTAQSRDQCMQGEAGVVCQGIPLLWISFPRTLKYNFFFVDDDTPMGNCSDGEVRLSGGTNALEGRVEVCVNNAWGTVCGDTFSNNDAQVVCSSRGHLYNGNFYTLSKM